MSSRKGVLCPKREHQHITVAQDKALRRISQGGDSIDKWLCPA
jgi:hypothetical protein